MMKKYKTLEELPMREYTMYALGASHAINFEEFKRCFEKVFLFDPCFYDNEQKEDKGQDYEDK